MLWGEGQHGAWGVDCGGRGTGSGGSDYMVIHGGKPLTGAVVDSHDDHRVAMAMAVCGLGAGGETVVQNSECAAVSFPSFFEVMEGLGAEMGQG